MLHWAALLAAFGIASAAYASSRPGAGFGPVSLFLLLMCLGIASLMALVHWLCRRNGWR